MDDYKKFLNVQLQIVDIKNEYEEFEPEKQIKKQISEIRKKKNLTQKQLADMLGMKQSNISRLESGSYNPSVELLNNIAKVLDKKLVIEFR